MIPLPGKILLAAILVTGTVLGLRPLFCFRHFHVKDLKGRFGNDQRRCSKCVNRIMNPVTKCSCGWKGRMNKVKIFVSGQHITPICPKCGEKI